jgi:hypothetical protein
VHAWLLLTAQENIADLESQLRRSRRAEAKLQALLYRLRQDAAAAAADAAAAGGIAAAFDRLHTSRSNEYDEDFWSNACRVGTPKGQLLKHQHQRQRLVHNRGGRL